MGLLHGIIVWITARLRRAFINLPLRRECWSDGGCCTLIILAEKMLPWPRLVPQRQAAAALVLYGALVIASSQLHPTFKKDGSAAMPAEMPMKMPGSGSAPAMK